MYLRHIQIFCLVLVVIWASSVGASDVGKHFWAGTKGAFTGYNKWVWLAGGTLTLAAFKYDTDIYHNRDGSDKFPSTIGDVMGTGIPGAGIAVLTMGAGWALESSRTFGAGQSHAEALVATFLYTSILKFSVRRDRPPAFSKNTTALSASFPSGHTSTAFATAGNMMASVGPLLGVPVLALAGLTGYSRIQQGAHYAADVLFGATLGYTMGTGFYKHHAGGRSQAWQIYPYFEDRENWGVAARLDF